MSDMIDDLPENYGMQEHITNLQKMKRENAQALWEWRGEADKASCIKVIESEVEKITNLAASLKELSDNLLTLADQRDDTADPPFDNLCFKQCDIILKRAMAIQLRSGQVKEFGSHLQRICMIERAAQ